jgi:hypothetical protein
MCMLCGALGVGRHWAERDRDAPALRQERRVRMRLLNLILRGQGMEARLSGRGYLVGPIGRPAVEAGNLGSLWSEVERLRGQPCDPLDPALLAALDEPGLSR